MPDVWRRLVEDEVRKKGHESEKFQKEFHQKSSRFSEHHPGTIMKDGWERSLGELLEISRKKAVAICMKKKKNKKLKPDPEKVKSMVWRMGSIKMPSPTPTLLAGLKW
jgi:hypothetical protein